MKAEAIARLRDPLSRAEAQGSTFVYGALSADLRALLDAHAALEHQNATLRLLVAGLTIAVDMEPSANLLEEPWVRLVEAAHKHGRKLERADERARVVADLRSWCGEFGITQQEHAVLMAAADRYERGEHEREGT